ncbi:MAG: hypothetical protein ONB17_09535 [candidate division KSB1 bacterium]|nr:hypothetical protein [candidate division KSB1 bacterium]MDZ7392426.1 hypothetical protein [candidate division KSB1 bacterium]
MNRWSMLFLGTCFLTSHSAYCQGYGGPLLFQGVEHVQVHSVASRGMGGISTVSDGDVAAMFNCPTSLEGIRRAQFAVAGWFSWNRQEQEQQYAPVRYYPNLSLLLEGLTGAIPDPNPELPGFTAADTVQRPYDNIGPNWSRSERANRPLHVLMAVPVLRGQISLVAGGGMVQYANLNHFYQNNNVLSPSILSQRPLPTLRPTDDNPLAVDWYQTIRSRNGALYGYGLVLAATAEKYHLSFGLSGLYIRGSSEDFEQEIGRGKLIFFSNAFRADSVYRRVIRSGTSDFSGVDFAVSGTVGGRYARIGFAVRPPIEIKRTSSLRVKADSTGLPTLIDKRSEDSLELPWRAVLGVSVSPRENFRIGFEYEVRPFASVRYLDPQGNESSPWLSSSPYRMGLEYYPTWWLALRAGMRNEAEVFEPEGNHLPGEPVSYSVYCAGIGVSVGSLVLDLACESGITKYQDIWSSAISKNQQRRWTLLAQVSYALRAKP